MIFELRSYDFDPAGAAPYLALFQREGLHLITRHLPLLGYWMTETGALNRLHHLWVYRDMADRAECRAGAAADRDWTKGFAPLGFPMIRRQQSCLMTLLAGSEVLDGAVQTARQPHPAAAAGAPVLGAGWATLAVASPGARSATPVGSVPPPPVARWRVLSGVAPTVPGAEVTLWHHAGAAEVGFPGDPLQTHEVLRCAAFSPL